MTTGGPNEGSSSSSRPPSSEEMGSGSGANAGRGGSPFRRPRGGHMPPVMGVPGLSAFRPYTRPPPLPPQHSLSPGPNRTTGSGAGGFGGGFRFEGAQAVPVGGSGSGGAAAPSLQIGGSPAGRKRVRDGPPVGGGNPPPVDIDFNPVSCSLCGKVFMTPKALFGHMRSHPERGWRGARPPPTFRAEEEFADLRPPDAPGGASAEADGGGGGGGAEDEEGQNYPLPDLNSSPPEDSST